MQACGSDWACGMPGHGGWAVTDPWTPAPTSLEVQGVAVLRICNTLDAIELIRLRGACSSRGF
jgi:hypothetical protein